MKTYFGIPQDVLDSTDVYIKWESARGLFICPEVCEWWRSDQEIAILPLRITPHNIYRICREVKNALVSRWIVNSMPCSYGDVCKDIQRTTHMAKPFTCLSSEVAGECKISIENAEHLARFIKATLLIQHECWDAEHQRIPYFTQRYTR